MNASENTADAKVPIGKVRGPHGVAGQVRVVVDIECPKGFWDEAVFTLRRGERERQCVVSEARVLVNGEAIVGCEGIDTREDAAAWTGADLLVDENTLPELPDGRFYYFEIEGMEVVTDDGRKLGTVDEILAVPQGEIFIVRKGGKELLIPSAGDIVRNIDGERRLITVRLLEGMDFS